MFYLPRYEFCIKSIRKYFLQIILKLKMNQEKANVRNMVEDVDASVEFYTKYLGFKPAINAS